MVNLAAITLAATKAEEVRRSHHDAIGELQRAPLAGAKVVSGVRLENGKATTVAHGLGRAPKWVGISAVRGASSAGFINETRGGVDAARVLVLTASGFGATITIDVMVT